MNKTAVKNFAIWARKKLIADIKYKAGLMGISEKEIKSALPQSTQNVQFFDIGTKEPFSISSIEIRQREKLTEYIINKVKQTDYSTAYKAVVEEVAYTWFNRLIAIRFMEVNDYLPSGIRVLSSESVTKIEPDMVTMPFDVNFDYTPYEKDRIIQLTHDTMLDELFRMLFIKQCNALNAILPNLFEKTNDFTELLLNISITDKDGVVYHLVHDIPEDDFNVSKEGQVEIIGWLYQYYNIEPKDEVFTLLKNNIKITKERIPAATQLFTPDWIVRYMVENSLCRLWLEGHPNDILKSGWKYYLDEAEQDIEVHKQLDDITKESKTINPIDIKIIDPCMGSGHILVYAFDVLIQIYQSCGFSQVDAALSIIENNIYGLDIDDRACQLAYFAVMMKGRQYSRHILNGEISCHIISILESNNVERSKLDFFGVGMIDKERKTAIQQMCSLLDNFIDAKEYGSILTVEKADWNLLYHFISKIDINDQISLSSIEIDDTKEYLHRIIELGSIMAQYYDVVVTNPPYVKRVNLNGKINEFILNNYEDSKQDLFTVFIEKNLSCLKKHGLCSMITQSSFLYKSQFKSFRRKIGINGRFSSIVKLGSGAFEEIQGEVVQSVMFTLKRNNNHQYNFKYIDLYNIKGAKEKEIEYLKRSDIYSKIVRIVPISLGPDYLFVNSVDETLNKIIVEPKIGCQPGSSLIFYWWEIQNGDPDFVAYNKGGSFRKWYGNLNWVLKYGSKGSIVTSNGGQISNQKFYFKEHISWTRVSSRLNMRFYNNDCMFDNTSPAIFTDLYYLLGYYNSVVCEKERIEAYGGNKIESGYINALAPITCEKNTRSVIETLVQNNILMSQHDWDSFETSWDFTRHPLIKQVNRLQNYGNVCIDSEQNYSISESLEMRYKSWEKYTFTNFKQLKANEEELNRIFINIYGLQDELIPEISDKDITIHKADLTRDIRSFVSYSVGCMFGRYSLDMDGLACSGGAFDNSIYSTFIPVQDNILPITDEEYFNDDIVCRFVGFVGIVYGVETLEQNLAFISRALGNKGNTAREIIRNYFVNDFYKDHVKIYQNRPIYWLFDSGKANGFKVLIYMHRYDKNTIGNLRIDYLHRLQRIYEREIAHIQEAIENNGNAREISSAVKRKEKLSKQLKETKDYDGKIAHIALSRITIDLDDGVIVNYVKIQTDTDGKTIEVLASI